MPTCQAIRRVLPIFCMACLLVCGVAGANAVPRLPQPGATPDYVRQPQAHVQTRTSAASRINFGTTACSPCWGETISYTTFSTPVQTFTVSRYDGAAVTL